MSDIAEKWANTPDPPRPTAQQDALNALKVVYWDRLGLADKTRKQWRREVQTARAAYQAGIDRPTIAELLHRQLQTIHNWVNPAKEPQWSGRYGDPSDDELRKAGFDV